METICKQKRKSSRTLEGSVRNTGIHACGVIITPDDITKLRTCSSWQKILTCMSRSLTTRW